MENAEQDRSEQPTPFKLAQARKKGTVVRGTDLGFFTAVAVFAGYMWVQGPTLGDRLAQAGREALVSANTVPGGPNEMLQLAGHLFRVLVQPLALFAATLFAVVLVFELLQTGFVFTSHPLKLDLSKLNPAKGLKRIFSLRMVLETGKNVLKLGIYTAIAWLVIGRAISDAASAAGDGQGLSYLLFEAGIRLIASFGAAALLFAALDQLIVRREFMKNMRMSRRELRRELRDREGEPRLKQRRKQLHAEFVKASKSLRNVKGADVVIVNPTHYAVALKYDASTMAAPAVVSKGTNAMAQRIKRLAFIYGIVVVENRELARRLFRHCALDSPIPDETYREVADIYRGFVKSPPVASESLTR